MIQETSHVGCKTFQNLKIVMHFPGKFTFEWAWKNKFKF